MSAPVILWFRDDLRLTDHAALHAAIATKQPVVLVYVLDETGPFPPGGAARWWLHHSLTSLMRDIERRDGRLILRRGPAVDVIPSLVGETGASAVFTGGMTDPHARETDRLVAAALAPRDVAFHRMRTATLFGPTQVRTKAGGPFGVYTPFSRACLELPPPREPLPTPSALPTAPAVASDALASWALCPTKPDWAGGLRQSWSPGEHGALERLARFLSGPAEHYAERRDIPAGENTSLLSPHLRFGEISTNQIYHAAAGRPDSRKFIQELLWREFSHHLLWHHPTLPDQPLRADFAGMKWREDPEALKAWRRGRTGVPIVDAGMRQLWETGWMHNRVRMIVASFLVKHLLIDWRQGQAWFWDTLVDADLANNAASWQWVAGCGADAAPFFRIFNPVLQGQKFDPDGAYVRRYVPELAHMPSAHIHAPWQAGGPPPLVDLAVGRERALSAFAGMRGKGPPP